MRYYFNKAVLYFCILFFFTIWYQIFYQIGCNFLCEKEVAVNEYPDISTMSPEELKVAFEKLRLERIKQMEALD
jgi:hypothetical protein